MRAEETWRSLRHDHLLQFLGVYKLGRHLYLVSPYIENGTLDSHLSVGSDLDRAMVVSNPAQRPQLVLIGFTQVA